MYFWLFTPSVDTVYKIRPHYVVLTKLPLTILILFNLDSVVEICDIKSFITVSLVNNDYSLVSP